MIMTMTMTKTVMTTAARMMYFWHAITFGCLQRDDIDNDKENDNGNNGNDNEYDNDCI